MKKGFKKFLSLVAGLFAALAIAIGQPPQKVNQNYQFKAAGADSAQRLPKVAPGSAFDSAGAIFYWPGDSSARIRTIGRNSIKVGPTPVQENNPINASSNVNPAFLIDAYGIPQIRNAYVLGDTIQWAILDSGDGHGSTWFTSVYGDPATNRLVINYPNVRNILSFVMGDDESFAPFGTFIGATVAFNQASAPICQVEPVGLMLTGNNSATWTASGNYFNLWTVSSYNPGNGQTLLDLTNVGGTWGYDPAGTAIQYVGSNNYHIIRQFSGLGSFTIGFTLVDASNNPVLTDPTGSDVVVVSSAAQGLKGVSAHVFDNSNWFLATSFNFWVRAKFEAWMRCRQIDSTTVGVYFQPRYPGASNYKVYRGLSPVFASQAQVYSGVTGNFIDTGLVQNAQYYYTMVATLSGVDTQITTYPIRLYNIY